MKNSVKVGYLKEGIQGGRKKGEINIRTKMSDCKYSRVHYNGIFRVIKRMTMPFGRQSI